jgi:hypothetical protein
MPWSFGATDDRQLALDGTFQGCAAWCGDCRRHVSQDELADHLGAHTERPSLSEHAWRAEERATLVAQGVAVRAKAKRKHGSAA